MGSSLWFRWLMAKTMFLDPRRNRTGQKVDEPPVIPAQSGDFHEIMAPLEGKFYRTKTPTGKPVKPGDKVKEGDIVGYIESMKVYNAIAADREGKVVEFCFNDGDPVDEDEALVKIE